MTDEMRNLVKDGYDNGKYYEVYGRTGTTLDRMENMLFEELTDRVPENSRILDLGCGVGLPYDKVLSQKGYEVTGIDISEKHIRLAKKNVPEATFIRDDFFSSGVSGSFDAIVSFYAIFHIPREEHAKLLKHMHSLLKDNGHILITLATTSMDCDKNPDFVGAPMAWSSYSVEENKRMIENAGFNILVSVEDYRDENHLWILASKN
ncbi:MAG: class I SAM-dependent methyltransferase [Nanobdellota archaeon]